MNRSLLRCQSAPDVGDEQVLQDVLFAPGREERAREGLDAGQRVVRLVGAPELLHGALEMDNKLSFNVIGYFYRCVIGSREKILFKVYLRSSLLL